MTSKPLLCRLPLAISSDASLFKPFVAISLLAITYFVSAKLGLVLALVHPSATAVWPPTGIALAAIIVFGSRLWPGIFLGALFANITTAGSVWISLGIATGNTLEAALGAYLVNRLAGGRRAFDVPQDVLKFAALAGVASTTVSATVGTTSLYLGGLANPSLYWDVWVTWWLGDMAGALVLAPLLILWDGNSLFLRGQHLYDRCLALVLLAGIGYLGFAAFPTDSLRTLSIAFLSIPFLLWTAVRFGRRESAAAVFLLTVIAIWGTVNGRGPFVRVKPNESLLLVQEFAGMIAVMIMTLSAAIWSRKRSEEALREADRRKDEFLATLGHELRNPLGVISTAIQLLRIKLAPDPELQDLRNTIELEVKQLSRLLDDLLDVSRIARGVIRLRKEPCDLTTIAREVVEAHRPMFVQQGLDLLLQLPDQPLWVMGDRTRLAQILGNLLYNANKFTDTGGRITVGLAEASTGDAAILTVRDTGIGMEPEILSRVFEPFIQADSAIDRSRGGLGLGLALVKGLVDLHGGKVWALSDGPGRGSQFMIQLSLAEQPAPVTKPIERIVSVAAGRRVLVIEDNLMAARSLRMFLQESGHTVEVALSGPDGIEMARRFRPDVLLCDIGLPGLDGYAVAQTLRQEPGLKGMYMIAVSGYGQDADQRRAFDGGFDAYLTKPIDLQEVDRLLANLIVHD